MTRRTTEMLLLLAAFPPILLLYGMYLMNSGVDLTVQTLAVPIGLLVAFIAGHISVRIFAPSADPAILPIVFVLSGIGITFVTRLAPDMAVRQVMWLFLSVAMMIVVLASTRSLEKLAKYKYTIIIVGILLLVLPIFIGYERWGSKLWIRFAGFSFQPGEIAKVLIVLFLASYLSENRELLSVNAHNILGLKFPRFRMMLPLLLMWGISLVIVVFQRDLGSAMLFFGIFLLMIYTATGRWLYVIIGLALAVVGLFGAYQLFGHVRIRFSIWLDPFADPSGRGLQIVQSLFSLADGGLFGQGIGRGMPTSIPVVESDFIFSAVAEEMGLLGGAGVIMLYMLFAVRGFLTAARARSDMAAFTAVGLTSAISLQAFIIMGGVTRLIPLTGVTLPFMSQGGSSLLASFIIVGLLLRAGDEGTGHEAEVVSAGETNPAAPALGVPSREAAGAGGVAPYLRHRFGMDTPESGVLGRVSLSKRLTVLVTAFAVLFAVLIGNLTFIQVGWADTLKAMPNNNHTIARAAYIERGSILTSDGVILAESVPGEDGRFSRSYPQGALASHLVGYVSQRYGAVGLEASHNETLTGKSDFSTWDRAIRSLAGQTHPGNDVVTTIDSNVQRAAVNALDGKVGAVVVLDPRSGATLAMASSPTFTYDQVGSLLASDDGSGPLYNRATQALYAPGSTFKALTLAVGLQERVATLDSVYSSPGTMDIGNAAVTNINETSHGDISLLEAFKVSSNTVFGQLAVAEGPDMLVSYSRAFGFGSNLGMDFRTNASLMPEPSEMTTWETAWAGVGQPVGEHESPAGPQLTVVQNALIAATIANNGAMMQPYVVEKVISPEGDSVYTTVPNQMGQPITAETAEEVKRAMREVVASGTGGSAGVRGVEVAGKTGTAQTSGGSADSWFIGFAPYGTSTVAIAIVIEDAGDIRAATLASDIMESALRSQGVLQ